MTTPGTYRCTLHEVTLEVAGQSGQHRTATLTPGIPCQGCALFTAADIHAGNLLPRGLPQADPRPCPVILVTGGV